MKNKFLNIIKALSAFAVILIHCNFPMQFGVVVDTLARYAVPFFFMISGYHCYYNDEKLLEFNLKRRIKKIIKLLIVSYIIYFFWNIMILGSSVEINKWLEDIFTIKRLMIFVLLNNSVIAGHLWFLNSLLYCYIFMLFFKKKKYYCIVYKAIPILLIIQILTGEVFSSIGINIPIPLIRNFWVLGMPFFMLGHFINNHENIIIRKFNNKNLILVFCVSNVAVIFERVITTQNELYIGSIIATISLFVFVIKNPGFVNNKYLEHIGDKCSQIIYICHPIIIYLVTTITKITNEPWIEILKYINPLLVIFITTLISYIFYKIKRKFIDCQLLLFFQQFLARN